ncbi:MAG: methylmalonyl-CoA mutase [Deltaproteobacteria bacterium]|jgi:methylmalonyl-CoA mutase, N-terminal domain|nr:methylmalonyl-CoA mutase [Deltaproteobacteria bacterium]MBT4265688.1 methylmalonyl-CoA mutase [Deltaproteobacteria bacterium]MBT4637697.1 methylmalonyl-CoA mutase [Deltaproteobacteria bacterium]MBT6500859.1 methylmalonyl-CoA mutase [Deltaproteobacteria bacterium]MBT7151733.1 methylmalonyl-CoA mutase [Deltaproteobacteria bacterium]
MEEKRKRNQPSDIQSAHEEWQQSYQKQMGKQQVIRNRSGLEVDPLYSPADSNNIFFNERLGFPGQYPFTRGIYPTMHRGRTWSQRQLIGLGTPDDYNERVMKLLDSGTSAISLLPCNSTFRGLDCDEIQEVLLGTCGTIINTIDHMETCLAGVPIEEISTAMNDPLPFTLLAFLLGVARRRGIPWERITGTSNQSDYISHFVANHMFFRLSLTGSRRMLLDHIAFCREKVPNWNPVSVVGQHMQQAGATPAETMGFTLSTAIQYAEDCLVRGMDIDSVLTRFTFFFDISISFFEEVAQFRAGRRIWARIARERLGALDPRSWRFKFHGQTSGVDLTRQQPLNNIARVTTQAIVGILSGLQSMHTDAYDEAISCPTEEAARIAVNTQNILREEAHLCDVIDPLGGSYYIESLTDQMEVEINSVIEKIDAAGGMFKAVESGLVQAMIGESALSFQRQIESGDQKLVGVNCYQLDEDQEVEPAPYRPNPDAVKALAESFKEYKAARSKSTVQRAIDNLARAANSENDNLFEQVVTAAEKGVTHGEIVACLRRELGEGKPIIKA